MSDAYLRIVDVEVPEEDAPAMGKKVIDRFRKLGLITGKLNKKCVLGEGGGYVPGPAITKYKVYRHDITKFFPPQKGYEFFDHRWNGAEPIVGGHYNSYAFPEAWAGATCSKCNKPISNRDDEFFYAICDAVQKWQEEECRGPVACPLCKKKTDITKWQCRTPLGIGNLSFSFWNWTEFDSPDWSIDIPAIVAEVTGTRSN
ncbi:hypothetical protein [Anatilimnocola floriformis]|uniref:hypothetical protein n=1 Tax=Anatilimnocola floriformis TaxID=2948575 RepID=UPI0020C5AA0B|nr:hypothetical protein [Anatilimnocola floriformis]